MEKVKLTDIAEAIGVSASTVSMVFNNRRGIPAETRQRVLEAAEKLGYNSEKLSRVQNGMALQKVGLVLRIFEEETSYSNPFYSVIISGIEAVCRKNQIQLLYAHVHVDHCNQPVEAIPFIDNPEVDGLILIGMYLIPDRHLPKPINPQRIVLVDGYSTGNFFDTVVTQNFQASVAAVNYLYSLGHRYIGMVAALEGVHPSLDERRAGYHYATIQHHLAAPFIVECPVHITGEGYYRAAKNLLIQHPDLSAIFCPMDTMAIETIKAAQDIGRRVPNDLSVIGFDGIDPSAIVRPSVTTISLDKFNMGQLAVRLLQQRVQFSQLPPVSASVPYQLVERESTGPLSTT
jgi:DNA-binding LacI/PurR family transcriptional regulator